MAAQMILKSYVVSGRVQGVGYRASTQIKALELGVHGWCRNRDDGTVEVLAIGEASVLVVFENWLWVGPGLAEVEHVESREGVEGDSADEHAGFYIRY